MMNTTQIGLSILDPNQLSPISKFEQTKQNMIAEGKKIYDYNANSYTINIDLRNRIGRKSHFGINDIHFSPLQTDPSFNVPIMILIEKQPRYPIYYGNVGNAIMGLTKALSNYASSVLSGKGKTLLGSTGEGLFQQTGEIAVKMLGNKRIEEISQKPSVYYADPNKYMNNILNLFTTVNGAKICSYELPFLSEYFLEADGDAGWQATGMEAQFGELARTMTNYNIGFPITPNWTYDSKRLSTEFTFNLINDTTENLSNNLKFIHTILPGMMHVLVNGSEMGKESTLSQLGQNIAGAVTTLFKSPNVYEVIVPGRFRWLWCTAKMDIKYKGKVYNEDLSSVLTKEKGFASLNYINIDSELIAFPEAYEISVTINSLLPQSFNEFYYGITNNGVGFTATERKSAGDKIAEGIVNMAGTAADILGNAGKSTVNAFNQLFLKNNNPGAKLDGSKMEQTKEKMKEEKTKIDEREKRSRENMLKIGIGKA